MVKLLKESLCPVVGEQIRRLIGKGTAYPHFIRTNLMIICRRRE
jgi:hypothetical protein